MANEEFGGELTYDQKPSNNTETNKNNTNKSDEGISTKPNDKFRFSDIFESKSDAIFKLLKMALPKKGDEFIDLLSSHRDQAIEYANSLDKYFYTPADVVEWLVNTADDFIDYLKDNTKKNNEDSNKESNSDKRYDYNLNEWIPYDEVQDHAKINKSILNDIVQSRILSGEDIDISKGVPSLEEMFSDDLAYDFFKNLVDSEKDSDITNAAFYCQTPDLNLGYDKSAHVFMLEYPSGASSFPDLKTEMHLNAIDGDTGHYYLNSLKGCDGPFTTATGQKYESFTDYCKKNKLDSSIVQVRYIGIDCPEIPHYSPMVMTERQIEKMTIREANSKGSVIYRKYNYNNGEVTDRNLDTMCEFYVNDNVYMEIVEKDTWDYVSKNISTTKKQQYQCNTVVTQDESEKNTLADGYRCRTLAYSVLKNAERIILKLDANGMAAKKTTSRYKLFYNYWWHGHKVIANMVDQWQDAMASDATPLSRLTFSPLGTDSYGRFIGEVYAYININGKMLWINVNKYVMGHVETVNFFTETNSPELNNVFGDNSKSFNLASYNKLNSIFLDSFEERTKKSYEYRLKFHKDITGIDFEAFRNCTMMIGDTLLLIPPTAIRNVSNVEYEKVNILRGKGSMVKGTTAREQYLEIDLYFYDEYGVNGIPYNHTLPNGQKMTYYMNGLRSLIAQFRVAPYLPIENQYINDILGIEAVSLVNLNVNTVEGFPRLLQATLTLRDFNYRIYMPDIPFDYGTEEELSLGKISEMNPIFAKCFNWEIFRYYYQRIISKGERLNLLDYGTEEYNTALYSSKYALKPVNFCSKSDAISFYIPDEDWLKAALEIKKSKDYYGQMPISPELTNNAKSFFEKVGNLANNLKINSTYARRLSETCRLQVPDLTLDRDNISRKNILKGASNLGNSMLKYRDDISNKTPSSAKDINIPNNIEDMFKGYKKLKVDGGDLSGTREPNAVVNIGFGNREYWAFTNEYGQLVKIVAKEIIVQDDSKEPVTSDGRYYSDEAKVPGVEYEDLDEGHVIADSLGGVSNAYNITPQDSTLNRSGEQYKIEKQIRDAGGCTNFIAVITYSNHRTQIPSHYSYSYVINGNTINKDFENVNPDSNSYKKENVLKDFIKDISDKVEGCGVLRYSTTDEEYDVKAKKLSWKIHFDITKNLSADDLLSIKENLRDLLGKTSIGGVLQGDRITVEVSTYIYNNTELSPVMEISCSELAAIANYNEGVDPTSEVENTYDYLNPSSLQFVPYLENVPLQGLAFNVSNTFTEMSLKIMDGSAPQYMGSSDISMELRIVTDNSMVISMLNVLPSHSMNIAKTYRRILNCWPLKIRQNYLNMAGINEVLIDAIQIENVEGYPGLYDIKIRLTSVDRIMRQREIMTQIESKEEVTTLSEHAIGTYYDIENSLSQAEVYPDLDLPTLSELEQVGYKFIRYSGIVRTYPDPDFYITYAYDYTAQLIKKTIRDVFVKDGLLHTNDENYECNNQSEINTMFQDHVGQKLYTKLSKISGIDILKLNGAAYYYSDAISEADKVSNANLKRDMGLNEDYDPAYSDNVDALMMLTLFDIEEGWEIKQGWEATVCPKKAEQNIRLCKQSNLSSDSVKKEIRDDKTYNFIFSKRKKLIECIDRILSKPLSFNNSKDNKNKERVDESLYAAIRGFNESADGKELLSLMCPNEFGYNSSMSATENIKFYNDVYSTFEIPNALNYMLAFLFASACAQSGDKSKINKKEWKDYFPNQYAIENETELKDDDGNLVPLSRINSAPSAKYAQSLKEAKEKGYTFGMFQITKENKDQILNRIMPTSNVDYLGNGKTFTMYKSYKDGFLDPYYNKLDKDNKELKDYINAIATRRDYNALAFIRIALVYLRKQIIDGLIISDIDQVAEEFHETIGKYYNEIVEESWEYSNLAYSFEAANPTYGSDAYGSMASANDYYETYKRTEQKERAGTSQEIADDQIALIESTKKSYAQSFCARWVFPFIEAATQQITEGPDSDTLDLIYNKRLDELNLLSASLLTSSAQTNRFITKFIMALSGNVINLDTTEDSSSTTSDSQKVLNILMREAFTELSEDPQAYILHSFYDMLVNDKRGRLVRAFPTYYILFIDEGRRIGSWKMFDNFYNMSAISELTVTKSRKIPTDTCSFVMTNMFGSYANEYDQATRENYVDVYSFRDVFTSIFSPREYISKEAALERRKKNTEVTVLKPGVRIHIRMGYSSDAAGLPIVFNGKIAEIDVGDVVTIIGQGDGSELVNPLNALGDLDATNLIESQSWCTLFKDVRGSLARGGLSPRNLLAQLLTAEHGGVLKNVARNISGERWFSDNPFGICHFGDKRFSDIFIEGEVTQNLYEVTDGTLLTGINELYASEQASFISPTLNTTIQDKTFWDLLTLAAYSGVGYIGAVRDFGLRSTVFLGKPNHYYAYAYTTMDGKHIEKRKPFQQFHYYDSYTDIIYNSIKASEKNIKTNATGIWEGTDLVWGSEQKTCGPIYLDINIYPEYQKSMTVDTGLIAAGNGGIDIPFVTSLAEDWNLSANTDKVNKTLAERVTTNTLRESIMNMYVGELCVIGDPSVKPYDRISICDTYEDMSGQMEVEAVVYSMNAATGFTTTIYPDLIVRQEDPHEIARQKITGTISAGLITVVAVRCGIISTMSRITSRILVGMSGFLKGVIAKSAAEGTALAVLKGTAAGKLLGVGKTGSLIKSLGSFFTTASIPMWTFMAVSAATIFVLTQNAKSFLTRWIRNIQALDVYPIFKNQRPYIAGMNGHRGSVVGYNYTEDDAQDSIQGMIEKCVNKIDDSLGGLGAAALNVFMDRDEYNKTVQNWVQTLTYLECGQEAESMNTVESIYQNAYNSVSTEFSHRSASIQMLRTKYRLKKFDTSGGTDKTYLKYRILGVIPTKDLSKYTEKIHYKTDSNTDIEITSLYTNKNVLSLFPIEDDIDVKKAIAGTHSIVKKLEIAHSKGNSTRNIPFESGTRQIRFQAISNPTGSLSSFPIMDMPLLQEDALYLFKFILNNNHLKNKKLIFMSGTRINDVRTWKNTGFCFELKADDATALGNALQNLKDEVYWTMEGKKHSFFEYKKGDNGVFVISVYPEAEHDYNNKGEE